MDQEELAAPEPAPGRKRAVMLPLFGLLLGLAYCIAALRYPIGTPSVPASGLFPLFVGLLLVGSSGVAAIAEWRNSTAIPDAAGPLVWRVPALAAALLVSFILFEFAGFPLAGAMLGVAVLALLERRPVWIVIVIACAISGATAILFALLGVPLPGVPTTLG